MLQSKVKPRDKISRWKLFNYEYKRNDELILFLGLTLENNYLENGNLYTEIAKINYCKNDSKKSSRFIFHYKMLTE